MSECGSGPTVEEEEAEYERARDERIETLYQGWGAREMAERIVDLEDELGGVTEEGLCTGMHANVAEAQCEVERLRSLLQEDGEAFRIVRSAVYALRQEHDRYRSAWISARRRAADEANFGMEALELKNSVITSMTADRDRWRQGHEAAESQLVFARRENARLTAELLNLRESTCAAPELEHVGTDEDGAIYRLRTS